MKKKYQGRNINFVNRHAYRNLCFLKIISKNFKLSPSSRLYKVVKKILMYVCMCATKRKNGIVSKINLYNAKKKSITIQHFDYELCLIEKMKSSGFLNI